MDTNMKEKIKVKIKVKIITKYSENIIKSEYDGNITGRGLINKLYNSYSGYLNYGCGKYPITEYILIHNNFIIDNSKKLSYYTELDNNKNIVFDFTNNNNYNKKIEDTFVLI